MRIGYISSLRSELLSPVIKQFTEKSQRESIFHDDKIPWVFFLYYCFSLVNPDLGPFLLTRIDFNPGMN